MKFLKNFKSFSKDQKGSLGVEFAVLFPMIFGLVAINFDAAVMMLRYTNLETALDKTVREVRLHGFPESNDNGLAYFKSEICSHATFIKNCSENIAVEMSPIDTSAGFTKPATIQCINRADNSEPVTEFTPGQQNDAVYVRACVVIDRVFPNSLPGIFSSNEEGHVKLVADTAYVVEPI
ncbi:hypothetical protein F9L33_05625 [Amylibacter sp. SFDW26]|uniref:TadE/TadG family type IV pilus assembly protein n=1 Tax=Amylibacter sp. SFDW26 TaxID=2652722 RepID=UPI001261A196|nr:hypothetical protein [Amylibacter sp. SFDW26]KAB7616228.1 hypothetical protein F9L33_05625 [Amylibacter sp. SFDW26]